MNTNPFRTGILTSEFYMSILGVIASILVARGFITVSQIPSFVDQTVQLAVSVYSGVVALIAIYKIVRNYLNSRVAIKTAMIQK